MNNRQTVRQAFVKSIPVMAGYIVLGIGFGILLRHAGYGALCDFQEENTGFYSIPWQNPPAGTDRHAGRLLPEGYGPYRPPLRPPRAYRRRVRGGAAGPVSEFARQHPFRHGNLYGADSGMKKMKKRDSPAFLFSKNGKEGQSLFPTFSQRGSGII